MYDPRLPNAVADYGDRHTYQQPDQVGYAAWWELFGTVVAFERLDGTLIYSW
jgi:hypothetical protein